MSTWTVKARMIPEIDGVLLDSATITSAVANVDLNALANQTQEFKRYEITYYNVVSDDEITPASGSLLTVYLGTQSTWYDHNSATSRTYITGGISDWGGEPNIAYQPQPIDIFMPQTLNMGFRLSNDVGGYRRLGTSGKATIFTPGTDDNGHDVDTKYIAFSQHGFIGGAAGVSAIPELTLPWDHNRNEAHTAGTYFSGDPLGTSFDWSSMMLFHGSFNGATGTNMTKFRFRMNGGDTASTALFAGGQLELRGFSPIT